MKNEEWKLHFLILVKREKGRGKNRADAMDEMVERRYRGNGWAMRMELVKKPQRFMKP